MLSGTPGPYRHIVLLNAAAAFLVADRVRSLAEGVSLAGQVIDDGTIFHLREGDYRLCSQERQLDWLSRSALGFDVSIVDPDAVSHSGAGACGESFVNQNAGTKSCREDEN